MLLELYETAKHCIQGGYIVRHVQDESYRQEVRTRPAPPRTRPAPPRTRPAPPRTRHAPPRTAPHRAAPHARHPADVVGAPPRAGAIGAEERAAATADGLVLEAVLRRDKKPDSAQGGRDVSRPATLGLAKAPASGRGARPLLLGRLVVIELKYCKL